MHRSNEPSNLWWSSIEAVGIARMMNLAPEFKVQECYNELRYFELSAVKENMFI